MQCEKGKWPVAGEAFQGSKCISRLLQISDMEEVDLYLQADLFTNVEMKNKPVILPFPPCPLFIYMH